FQGCARRTANQSFVADDRAAVEVDDGLEHRAQRTLGDEIGDPRQRGRAKRAKWHEQPAEACGRNDDPKVNGPDAGELSDVYVMQCTGVVRRLPLGQPGVNPASSETNRVGGS